MRAKVVAFDMDGVLANFNLAYSQLAERLFGNNLGRTDDYTIWPPCWSYEREFGLTPAQVKELWQTIEASGKFWESLTILQSPATLNKVAALTKRVDVDTYFITSRMGYLAKWQSENWLRWRVGVENPTVLISHRKGPAALGLNLTHFIDDRTENCIDVKVALRKRCAVYCLAKPYNKDSHFKMQSIGIEVVERLEDFIERI